MSWKLVSLVDKKQCTNNIVSKSSNYYDLSSPERLRILKHLLDNKNFEVYKRKEGEICIYDKLNEEFITENGFAECNLVMFFDSLIDKCN